MVSGLNFDYFKNVKLRCGSKVLGMFVLGHIYIVLKKGKVVYGKIFGILAASKMYPKTFKYFMKNNVIKHL